MKNTCPAASAAISAKTIPTDAHIDPARSASEATDDLRHLHHRLIMDLDEERQFWRSELVREHERLRLLKSLSPAHVLAKYRRAEQALAREYSGRPISSTKTFVEEAGEARSN